MRNWAKERGLSAKDKKARQWFRNDEQINEIIEEQGKVEVTCEFCKDAVVFTEEELLGAKDEM